MFWPVVFAIVYVVGLLISLRASYVHEVDIALPKRRIKAKELYENHRKDDVLWLLEPEIIKTTVDCFSIWTESFMWPATVGMFIFYVMWKMVAVIAQRTVFKPTPKELERVRRTAYEEALKVLNER